jgi:hypothetical protein
LKGDKQTLLQENEVRCRVNAKREKMVKVEMKELVNVQMMEMV